MATPALKAILFGGKAPWPQSPTVLDAFGRTENPIASGWTALPAADADTMKTNGSAAQPTTISSAKALNNAAYYSTTSFAPDQYVFMTHTTLESDGTSGNTSLFLRLQNIGTGTVQGYALDCPRQRSGLDEWRWRRVTASAFVAIGTSFFQEVAANDSVGMSVVGTKLYAWYKPTGGAWQMLAQFNDSTYPTGGFIGMSSAYGFGVPALDNFGGGNL